MPAVLFLAANAVVGVIAAGSGSIGRVHYLTTMAVALGIALVSRRLDLIAAAAAYVAASDVFWRATAGGEGVFWEAGKYGMIAVLALGFLRLIRSVDGGVLALSFLAVLLPSTLLTVDKLSLAAAREPISFNLSGPLALGVAVLFFRRLQAGWDEMRTVLVALVGPIVIIATLALVEVSKIQDLQFSDESNTATSGGYGPNQVSNLLGLGALVCFFVAFRERRTILRVLMAGLGLWMFGQSLFTFSRSGLYGVGIAAVAALLVALVRSPRRAPVLLGAGVVVIACLAVFSYLDDYTGGALETRFASRSTTGRSELAEADFQLFERNPLFGVGPGMAALERTTGGSADQPAHTELTRLLAEHGVLGVGAVALLGALGVVAVRRQRTAFGASFAAALVTWSFVTMSNTAMRIAVISFAFGLAFLDLVPDNRRRLRAVLHEADRSSAGGQPWSTQADDADLAEKARVERST